MPRGEYRIRGKYTRIGNPKDCAFESTGWIESTDLLVVEGDTTSMEDDSVSCWEDPLPVKRFPVIPHVKSILPMQQIRISSTIKSKGV
jgi:hypothetical protein